MSKRKQRMEVERAAADKVNQQIASATLSEEGPPLGEDILLLATQRYRKGFCPSDQLQQAAADVAEAVRKRAVDMKILSGRFRSLSPKKNAAAILVMLPKAVPFRADQFFVGLYSFAFGFWRDRALMITAVEPGGVPTHLHQRIVQRSQSAYASLAEAQDRFSDLWPCLVELGQRRRKSGRIGNVGDFVSPWADGLMFGDFASVDFSADELHLARPVLFDYDPRRGVRQYEPKAAGFKNVATMVGMKEVYDTYYRGLSTDSVHVNVSSLIDMFDVESGGIKVGPGIGDYRDSLNVLLVLGVTLVEIANHFLKSPEIDVARAELEGRATALMEK